MADRRVRARLQVARPDGATLVDLTDHLVRAKVNLGDVSAIGTGASGVDVAVRQLEIELANERNEPTGLMPFSFSRASAPLNSPRFVDVPGWGKGVMVEEGVTNLLPIGADDFAASHGWSAVGGAVITITPGQPDPFGGNNAYRIQSTGGTSANKYQGITAARPNPHTDTAAIWIKKLSGNASTGLARLTKSVTTEWQRLSDCIVDFAGTASQLYIGCPTAGESLDVVVYWPSITAGTVLTSYTAPGTTRSPESLTSPSTGLSLAEGFHVDLGFLVNANAIRQVGTQLPTIVYMKQTGAGAYGVWLAHSYTSGSWSLYTRNDANVLTQVSFPDSLTPVGSLAFFRINVQSGDSPYAGVWGWKADGTWGELAHITNPLLPSGLGLISWLSQNGTANFLNTDLCEARTGRGMDFNPPPKHGGMGPNQATTAFSNFNNYINYQGPASLHPRDRASSWNQFGGSYQPLLWPYRQIFLDVATCPIEREPLPSEWVRLFSGYMGDSISGVSDTGRITVLCRDPAFLLQSRYIETVREYGSTAGTPAETVIQKIIDDNLGTGFETLYCPVSPGFMITPYQVEYQTVWDACQAIATQIGWFLGYRWDAAAGDFRLTLMEPPRAKDGTNPDFVLDWDDNLRVQSLDVKCTDVRNVVKVTYRNKATKQRASVTVEDADSIAAFGGGQLGRRAMEIEEADTSLIDTEAEALALANAALADLKDLTASSSITLQLTPALDIFAGVNVVNPLLSSTTDFYAVETVVHSLDWSGENSFKASTEIVCSGRVIGGHGKWLRMQTRPGAWGQPNVPADMVTHTTPAVPTGLIVSPVIKGIAVSLDEPANDPFWDGFEIHVSAVGGFTPSAATLKARGRATQFTIADLTPGTVYYVRAVAYDTSGNLSTASPEYSLAAGRVESADVTPGGITSDLLAPSVLGFSYTSDVPPATGDVRNLMDEDETHRATWALPVKITISMGAAQLIHALQVYSATAGVRYHLEIQDAEGIWWPLYGLPEDPKLLPSAGWSTVQFGAAVTGRAFRVCFLDPVDLGNLEFRTLVRGHLIQVDDIMVQRTIQTYGGGLILRDDPEFAGLDVRRANGERSVARFGRNAFGEGIAEVCDLLGRTILNSSGVQRAGSGGVPIDMYLCRDQRFWAKDYIIDGLHLYPGQGAYLAADRDAGVDPEHPDTSFGTGAINDTGELGQGHILLHFPLALPSGVTVSKAILKVFVLENNLEFRANGVAASWSEETVTFNNGPELNYDYSSADEAPMRQKDRFVELDVTDIVQGMANGLLPNGEIAIVNASRSIRNRFSIASREFSNSEQTPHLLVIYSNPAAPGYLTVGPGHVCIRNQHLSYPTSSQGLVYYQSPAPGPGALDVDYDEETGLFSTLWAGASSTPPATGVRAGAIGSAGSNFSGPDHSGRTGRIDGAFDLAALFGNRFFDTGWVTVNKGASSSSQPHNMGGDPGQYLVFVTTKPVGGATNGLHWIPTLFSPGAYEWGVNTKYNANVIYFTGGAQGALFYTDPSGQQITGDSAAARALMFRIC